MNSSTNKGKQTSQEVTREAQGKTLHVLTHRNKLKTRAWFTRQPFRHGTRLNLAPVPKICSPAPSIFVV